MFPFCQKCNRSDTVESPDIYSFKPCQTKKNQHRQTDGVIQNYLQHDHKMFPWHRHRREDELRTDDILTLVHELTAFFSQTKQAKKGLKRRRHLLSATNTPKYENNSPQPSHFTAERYWCFHGIIKLPSPATAGQDFLLSGGKYSCFHTSKDAGWLLRREIKTTVSLK